VSAGSSSDPLVIARAMPRRPTATAAMTSDSNAAPPAVVQPMPIRSMTGPWTREPIG
jgi:hypothetical protein